MSKVNFIPGRWGQGYIMHQQRILLLGPQPPLLLDDYPGAAAAYSLRKLRTDYTGAAIRVRESATNTEADIGFTSSGELDTTALLAHTGANNGFVVTWFDQSGNARNATQANAANQPQIVSGGSVILENSKPTIQFDGSSDYLESIVSLNIPDAASAFTVVSDWSGGAVLSLNSNILTDDEFLIWSASTESKARYNATPSGGALIANTALQQLFTAIAVRNANVTVYRNGSFGAQQVTATAVPATVIILRLGARNAGNLQLSAKSQEIIVFPSDQSSNRTAIESNINAHYNIYPVPADYGTEYAAILQQGIDSGYSLPSITVANAQAQLIDDLKSAGIWNKLDIFYVFATNGDSDFATLNWKTPASFQATKVNSPTFTSLEGFTGNGTSSYLNTNWTPTTDAVNLQAATASMGYYIRTALNIIPAGTRSGGFDDALYEGSNDTFNVNTDNTSNRNVPADSSAGFRHLNRTASNAIQRYINGALNGSNTNASSQLSDSPLFVLALNDGNTPISFSNNQIAVLFAGASLATEASDFFTAIEAYMDAIGKGVV